MLDFKGKDILIQRIDEAVSGDCPLEVTTCLSKALTRCIGDPDIRLPDEVFDAKADHYARRELYQDPDGGYCVIAMTWGPGQGTPIHDHSGMWCVEGVWAGCIEVVQYSLQQQQGDRFQFEQAGTIVAGCGSSGSLIPPYEYHTISNAEQDRSAVSVHIYSGPMETCSIFEALDDGWHLRHSKQLALD